MEAQSLALATELAVLATRGVVHDRGAYLVVDTPAERGWSDGNFLALPRAPRAPELPTLEQTFAKELGGDRAISLRWDDSRDDDDAIPELTAAGYEVDLLSLMLREPALAAPPPHALVTRPLSAMELAATAALAYEVGDRHDVPYQQFLRRRARWQQQLVTRDLVRFYGAFDAGALVASLGIFFAGDTARYQDVQTRASHRRRGLAGTLLALAAQDALARGAQRLAIIAQPGSDASRLYARLGFATAERSTRAWRRPRRPPRAQRPTNG